MTLASAEAKQAVIRSVLQALAAVQAPSVRVRLGAGFAEGADGLRGLLNPTPRPAGGSPRPADESAIPAAFRENALRRIDALRVGEGLHVLIDAPAAGHLHLFNLGSSGNARRMLPRPGEAPPRVEANRVFLASPAGDAGWVEQGPANGFPERVLAVITAEPASLPATCLHPSWDDAALARGFEAPLVEPMLSAWPAQAWAWGICEAPVEP